MFDIERDSLPGIVDWFTHRDTTYMRVFGAYKSPHVLPTLIKRKVLLWECGLSTHYGFIQEIIKYKKAPWPTFP